MKKVTKFIVMAQLLVALLFSTGLTAFADDGNPDAKKTIQTVIK